MGNYITTDRVWKALGTDAYTKIRDEIVGTGNNSTTNFSLDHDNVISGSTTVTRSGQMPNYSITGNGYDSGSNSPNGSYTQAGEYGGYPYYTGGTGIHTLWLDDSAEVWVLNGGGTGSISGIYSWYRSTSSGITGSYTATSGNTGSPLVSVYDTGSTVDLDDGEITFNGAPKGGNVITIDYLYADIPDSQMQILVNQAEQELEYLTGRKFYLQTESAEYIDVRKTQNVFFTRNYPVINITVSANTSSEVTDTPGWSASTEGLGNDYLMDDKDKEIGKLEYIDNPPLEGQKRLKINYVYGYSTIPEIVKELTTLLAIRKMVNSSVYKAIFKGRDDFSPARLNEIEARINQLTAMLRKQNIDSI